jgi:type III pantothenate kinase
MLLAIDAGNTRTKWAVFNSQGEISQHHACLNSELALARFLSVPAGCNRIMISNVAGKEHAALLREILADCRLPIFWLQASMSTCKVINRYEKPETLGSDRWAGLIAAWHLKHQPCIIVNAGTAVTVDALSNCKANGSEFGEFIGGLILPGLSLMQQTLGRATAQLPKTTIHHTPAVELQQEIFAKNTADAIYNGAVHAIIGTIEQMATALNKQHSQPSKIVISGGDAQIIAQALMYHVTNQVSIVDNLVLQGLYLIDTNEN